MRPPTSRQSELLRYLAEIGWSEVRFDAPRGRAAEGVVVKPSPVRPQSGELAEVEREAAGCRACGLSRTRQKVVFGSGSGSSGLMLVGEGPGAEEDRQGLPFVGPAGALLTRIIGAIGLTREQTYIANIVKCRPPGNRDPLPDEIAACGRFLERQIDLVRPRVIVALGRIAAQALLGSGSPVGKLRGQWWQVRGIPTMVTYHPAAILRNRAFKRPTWEDMQQVSARLQGTQS